MKLTFVFFALAICAALGIGFWLSFSGALVTPTQLVEVGAVPATPAAMPAQIAGRAPLSSLLNQTESLECEFRFNSDDYLVEGNSFIADAQLRVDALYTMSGGETAVASFILTDDVTYVWNEFDGESLAMMFPVDDATMNFEASAEGETGPFINPAETVQYTCIPWQVDNSVFAPPATLDFLDMTFATEGEVEVNEIEVSR